VGKNAAVQEIRVESWAELQDALWADAWQPGLARFRSDFAFRGRNDAGEQLVTSLQRLGGDVRALERHLLRNFRRYAPHEAALLDSPWNWLALGQHHGLPTRLLDFTHSPLVALHFVTSDLESFGRDGVVWMVDYVQAQQEAPEALRAELDEAAMNVLFLEPPALNERIVNQYALFSLASRPDARLDEWLEARPQLVRRVVVPAELKWEVRDKLDQANVTERVLFPGLDGLSRWLKRYYLPRT
jgi:hypothetical protein